MPESTKWSGQQCQSNSSYIALRCAYPGTSPEAPVVLHNSFFPFFSQFSSRKNILRNKFIYLVNIPTKYIINTNLNVIYHMYNTVISTGVSYLLSDLLLHFNWWTQLSHLFDAFTGKAPIFPQDIVLRVGGTNYCWPMIGTTCKAKKIKRIFKWPSHPFS